MKKNYAICNAIKYVVWDYLSEDNIIWESCTDVVNFDTMINPSLENKEALAEQMWVDLSEACLTPESIADFRTICEMQDWSINKKINHVHPSDESYHIYTCTTDLPDSGTACSDNDECLGNCIVTKSYYDNYCEPTTAELYAVVPRSVLTDLWSNYMHDTLTWSIDIKYFLDNMITFDGSIFYECNKSRVGFCSINHVETLDSIDQCGDQSEDTQYYEMRPIIRNWELVEYYDNCCIDC